MSKQSKKGQAQEEIGKPDQELGLQSEMQTDGKREPQFVEVELDVVGKFRGKNYVDLKGMAFNAEKGHLSFHLNEKDTMIFREPFIREYLKVVPKEATGVETSVRKAPQFDNSKPEKSTARMRLLGERDGRRFLGPSASVKHDGSLRGFQVNIDEKHILIVDAEMLSRDLGLKMSPIAMERNVGLSR